MWRTGARSLRSQCGSNCYLTIQGNKRSDEDAGPTDQQGEARECNRLAASQEKRLKDEEVVRPAADGAAEAREGRVEQATWEHGSLGLWERRRNAHHTMMYTPNQHCRMGVGS